MSVLPRPLLSLKPRLNKGMATALCLFGAVLLTGAPSLAFAEYLQCVTFARSLSGIQIRGDAHTWWPQAKNRYATGQTPRPGSVLSFPSQGRMSRGHVAVVTQVITERVIQITHANWSPIGGRRGQVEDKVTVVDVSPNNNWTEVRVWYAPIKDLGTTVYRTNGFIYGNKSIDRVDEDLIVADNGEPSEAVSMPPQAPIINQDQTLVALNEDENTKGPEPRFAQSTPNIAANEAPVAVATMSQTQANADKRPLIETVLAKADKPLAPQTLTAELKTQGRLGQTGAAKSKDLNTGNLYAMKTKSKVIVSSELLARFAKDAKDKSVKSTDKAEKSPDTKSLAAKTSSRIKDLKKSAPSQNLAIVKAG